MSLEAKIEELTAAVNVLTAAFAVSTAQGVPSQSPAQVVPSQSPAPAGEQQQPIEEEKKAPVQPRARRVAAAAPKAETVVAPPAEDGGFLDEPAVEQKEFTEQDVRSALVAFQKAVNSQDKARKLLKEVGGADTLSGLPKEKYKAVIDAASKR